MTGSNGNPRRDAARKTPEEGLSDDAPELHAESLEEDLEGQLGEEIRQEMEGRGAHNRTEDTPPGDANFDIAPENIALEPGDEDFAPISNPEAQLLAEERVPEDMGTIALERVPGDRKPASQVMPPFLGGMTSDLGQMTDAEIMQRAGAGDDTCFEFLVAKYRRPIISFMYRMVHNQAIAEELAQEVFLRVYRARGSYRAEARFTTWLYRIAANMAINNARDTKLERASSNVYLDQADEETGTRPDVADLRPLAEQDMLRDERMRRIREHVTALPERQRMAVLMHKYQDMDYKQIGAVLKLSESATKSLLFRAYQTLRDRLKEFA